MPNLALAGTVVYLKFLDTAHYAIGNLSDQHTSLGKAFNSFDF
jgi:hypothetical protein